MDYCCFFFCEKLICEEHCLKKTVNKVYYRTAILLQVTYNDGNNDDNDDDGDGDDNDDDWMIMMVMMAMMVIMMIMTTMVMVIMMTIG